MNREAAMPVGESVQELAPQRRFRTYPDCRESGVQWLGRVPRHWDVCRTKHVAALKSGHTPSRQKAEYWQDCSIPWFTLADVWQLRDRGQKYLGETTEKISELGLSHSAADLLPKGTVILSRTASVGFTGIMPHAMATSQDFVNWVCGPRIVPDYLWCVYQAMRPEFDRLIQGSTHKTIYMPDARAFSTPVPTYEEQQAIAAFLDRETAQINALVAKNRRLIELLAEKRTALISHAVTTGLNPEAPTKNSGVESLGSIPEHWTVQRIASFATKLTNGFVGPTRDILVSNGLPYIQSLHIKQNSVVFDGKYFVSDEWLKAHEKVRLATDDVLVVQTGDIGQVACAPSEFDGAGCHALIIIRPEPRVMRGPFLSLLLNSEHGYHSLKRIQTGALHPHLNCTFVREVLVPVPPLREQDAILRQTAELVSSLSELRERILQAIDRLREYRSALISAAVTGKIDVRGEVA